MGLQHAYYLCTICLHMQDGMPILKEHGWCYTITCSFVIKTLAN